MIRSLKILAVVGALMVACSESSSKPPPGSSYGEPSIPVGGGGTSVEGGTSKDASVGDADLDGGECNDLDLANARLVDRTGVADEPPTGTGGAIKDGTYYLTNYTAYVGAGGIVGPTGVTARGALRITDDTLEQVLEFGGNSPTTTERTRSTFVLAAATFSATLTCPGAGTVQRQYSAPDGQIVFIDNTTKEAFTFDLR